MDKWAEKQEAAKERREAKQREKQQMKPGDKQSAPSAEFLARCSLWLCSTVGCDMGISPVCIIYKDTC